MASVMVKKPLFPESARVKKGLPPPLSFTHLCPVERQLPLGLRMQRRDTATRFQALWRGYTERKAIQRKNAEEVRRHTPIWRSYDDQYRMYVFCQTLMAELKKDDPTWDATQEPYYIWMLEHGPVLEEWETFLQRRGWVRPKTKAHLNTKVFMRLIQGVVDSCGLPMGSRKVSMALYNTFCVT